MPMPMRSSARPSARPDARRAAWHRAVRLGLCAPRRGAGARGRGSFRPAVRGDRARARARDAGRARLRERGALLRLARDRRAARPASGRAARRQRPPPRRSRVQGDRAGAAPGGAYRRQRSGTEHQGRAVSRRVVVLPTGTANLASVLAAFARLGAAAAIARAPAEVEDAERVVLPGVGTFGATMAGLRAAGLAAARAPP